MSPRAYRSTVRSQSVQNSRNRIVEEAEKLIASSDPSRFSLEAVAKAAGVTRLTVYNHFGSRGGLLEAVYDALAERGGLHRIPEAFAEPDPELAIDRLVSTFCDFWASGTQTLHGLYAASMLDFEFRTSLHARNERRRDGLAIIAVRLNPNAKRTDSSTARLVDILFVLTSFHVFSELSVGRNANETKTIVGEMIRNATSTYGQSD